MKSRGYESAFAEDIKAFLIFKEEMGFYGKSREWSLWKFDTYCAERGLVDFNRESVEGWVIHQKERNPGGCYSWMSYIRDFGRYLSLSGRCPDAYILSGDFRAGFTRSQPFLLSSQMIDDFFEAAREHKAQSPWQWQARCFFGLMYSMGLRTCEAIRLNTCDVDMDSGHVDILWSKGNRSRRLPINDEVAAMLDECSQKSSSEFGDSPRPFFIGATGKRVWPASTGIAFNRIWDSAGLPRQEGKKQPGPYSLRHHFAYANIEKWAREGKSVEAMMPYLARYMGHATFDSTYYYIHTSPDFLSGYAGNVKNLEMILPEVGFDD